MIKIKEKTIKEWIPLEKIYKDGTIKLKNNNYIKIIKIMPINYNLKSELEKKSKRLEQLEQEKKQLEKHFLGRFVLEKYNK